MCRPLLLGGGVGALIVAITLRVMSAGRANGVETMEYFGGPKRGMAVLKITG